MSITKCILKEKNLAQFIEAFLSKYGSSTIYSCLGQEYTFEMLERDSRKFAYYFQHELKLKQGDRIAIQLPNLIQYPIAMYGALRAGLVIVNTNPIYTPREMAHQFNDSGARALVILSDLLPKYEEIRESVNIEHIISTHTNDLLHPENEYPCQSVGFNHILSLSDDVEFSASTAKLTDTCVLQYTGGTTGVSKGAELTHANLLHNVRQTRNHLPEAFRPEGEIMVCPLPLYHIYAFNIAMLIQPSVGNMTILIPEPRDLDSLVQQIAPYPYSVFVGLNTLFIGLCQHADFNHLDFSALNLTISGGTALTQSAATVWKSVTGSNICEGYGLTETSPVITLNQANCIELGTVGFVVEDTEVEFWDHNDKPVPHGECGQLVCRGPQVMKGYWQRPEDTSQAISASGFFRTGDIGMRLADGKIKIVDRLKDMIIVSGFNVFPNEIEATLLEHPSIVEAAVIGQDDDKTGEKVCAYITVNNPVSEDEIRSFCRKYMTAYKVPKTVIVMEELPKSSVGKILRRELR